MELTVLESFLLVAITIAAALCCWQYIKLRRLRKERTIESSKVSSDKHNELKTSVHTLSLCLVQGQVDLSEGCWRVKLHLDHLLTTPEMRQEFQVFYDMYDEISVFDTHQKRNQLSKQERFDQDKKRFEIEDRYREEIVNAAGKLLKFLDQ